MTISSTTTIPPPTPPPTVATARSWPGSVGVSGNIVVGVVVGRGVAVREWIHLKCSKYLN